MIIKNFNGIEIPALGMGTYRINDPSIIRTAINIGYRHIDTAKSYHNEAEVGEGWKKSGVKRSELFITTKIWHDRLRSKQIKEDTQDSLKKLQTDYIDLLLIHWPSSENIPLGESLQAFEELKQEGKIKSIGVSNFTPNLLEEAKGITQIFCNQIEYHPFLVQHEMLKYCTENGIALTAYRPIAKNEVSNSHVIKDIAEKHKKSPAQITLRWLVQQDPILAIPRSSSEEHLKSNLDIFDFELSKDEMEEIFNLDEGRRQVDPAFAPW